MKVYVAAKFEEAPAAYGAMSRIASAGHTITHDWTRESVEGLQGPQLRVHLESCALGDFRGVLDCDALVLLNHPKGRGMFVEMGIALGRGATVIVVDPGIAECIFFHLGRIHLVASVDEAIVTLRTLA